MIGAADTGTNTHRCTPRWLLCAVLLLTLAVIPTAVDGQNYCPTYREPELVSKNFNYEDGSDQYLAPKGCTCVEGMSDLHCAYCETDEGCQTAFTQHICQKGVTFTALDLYKAYKCRLHSLLEQLLPGGKLSFFVNTMEKTAHMSVYKASNLTEPINGQHLLDCDLSGCETPVGGANINCEVAICNCTEQCDRMTRTLLETAITGNRARFQITDEGKDAHMEVHIDGAPFRLEAMCQATTCALDPIFLPPTEPPTTAAPTGLPTTLAPTGTPTMPMPTRAPVDVPTVSPTEAPTNQPSELPTGPPTLPPSDVPTMIPSEAPSLAPVAPLPEDCPAYRRQDLPDKHYDYTEHGLSVQYMAPNGCSCVDGMSDLHCLYCKTDEACQSEHGHHLCQEGPLFGIADTYKSYKCKLSSLLEAIFPGGKLSFLVDIVNKSAELSIYNWDIEEPVNGGHAIDCQFSGCDFPLGGSNFSCALAVCNCTDQCNEFARGVVDVSLSGKPAFVSVNEQGAESHVSVAIEGAPFELEAMCTASACVAAPTEAPTVHVEPASGSSSALSGHFIFAQAAAISFLCAAAVMVVQDVL